MAEPEEVVYEDEDCGCLISIRLGFRRWACVLRGELRRLWGTDGRII